MNISGNPGTGSQIFVVALLRKAIKRNGGSSTQAGSRRYYEGVLDERAVDSISAYCG